MGENTPPPTKTARADIEIDSPELSLLINIKQIRKRLQSGETVRIEFEIGKETIDVINAFKTTRNVLALFQ